MSEVEKNLDTALNGSNGTAGQQVSAPEPRPSFNEYEVDTSDEEVTLSKQHTFLYMDISTNFNQPPRISEIQLVMYH